jgi:CBS-domain-containing membrane protein
MTKIFGGEPASILYGLQVLLAALVAWNVGDLTQDQAGTLLAVAAAIIGVITAWATRDTRAAAVVAAVNAIAVAFAAWGLNFTPDQISTVALLAGAVAGGFNRQITEPLETGTFQAGAAAGPRYGTQVPVPDPVT